MIPSLMPYLYHLAVIKCGNDNSFFSFPTWYKYLPAGTTDGGGSCTFAFKIPDDIPLVALAMLDIALRVAGLVAIAYVIYGGVIYVTSQGEPDQVGKAKGTIINALIGLILATFAVAIVAFIGNKVG